MKREPLLAAALVVAAGLAGFLGYRALHPAAVRATGPATAGLAGPAADTAAADDDSGGARAAIPDTIPALSMPDLAGHPQPLRGAGGHPRLYNFWATWCEPCRREIPLLDTLQARYRADGLEVVGVAIDTAEAVRTYVRRRPMGYTLLVGEDEGLAAAQALGVQMVLPFSVFADESHEVVAVKLGELHADEIEAILGRMRALRGGSITLEATQAAISDDLQALSVKRAKQKRLTKVAS